jgi:hypothetical protein
MFVRTLDPPWIGTLIGLAITVIDIGWADTATDWFKQRGAYWGNPKFAAADLWGGTVPFVAGCLSLLAVMICTFCRVRKRGCTLIQWWWLPIVFFPFVIWMAMAVEMDYMKITP